MIGPAPHRAGIIDQKRHHRIAEIGVALHLEGERRQRIGHDAGNAGGIEDAFLDIEIPGAVLLCHQAALQPIGEPCHHAGEIDQLLVEKCAQPFEFDAVADIFRPRHLVKLGGEHLVIADRRLVGERQFRPLGLARIGRIVFLIEVAGVVRHLRFGIAFGGFLVLASHLALTRRRLIGLGIVGRLSGRVAILGLLLLAVLILVLVGVATELITHLEVDEQIARRAGKGLLAGYGVGKPVEVGAGPLLDELAPGFHQRLRTLGRRAHRSASRAPSARQLPKAEHPRGSRCAADWPGGNALRAWPRDCRPRPAWHGRRAPRSGLAPSPRTPPWRAAPRGRRCDAPLRCGRQGASASASPAPRVTATSKAVGRRGGSGTRALWAASDGRSAANTTSSSPSPEMARIAVVTAFFSGSTAGWPPFCVSGCAI